jgi:hypothetical protein
MPIRGVLAKVLIVSSQSMLGEIRENAFLLHRQNLIFGMFRLQDAIKYARLFAQPDMVLTVFIEPIIYWLDGPFPEHAGFPWFPACRL